MISLVRSSGKSKPIGETSEVYNPNSSTARCGDTVEITDNKHRVINLARIVEVNRTNSTLVIKMVA